MSFWNARKIKNDISLLVISDTHGVFERKTIRLPEFDYCLLLGDMTTGDLVAVTASVPADRILAICGNHDEVGTYEKFGIENIDGRCVERGGISFLGLERCEKRYDSQLGHTRKECRSILENNSSCDVLLTHETPEKYGLSVEYHDGNPLIDSFLRKSGCPLCLCGHNHQNIDRKLFFSSRVIEVFPSSLITVKNGIITSYQEDLLCGTQQDVVTAENP